MSEASDRKQRLAQLAAKRRSGKKSRVESYNDEEMPMYDLVDEDKYRRDLEDDNFVEVNDGDHGYTYDDGTNDLGDSKHNYYSDDDQAEMTLDRKGQSKKRKAKQEPAPEPKKSTNRSIKTFLAPIKKEAPVS